MNAKKIKYKFIKHQPAIMCVVGVIGFGVTIYTACKATLKAQDVIKEEKEKIEEIHEKFEDVNLIETGEYSEKQYRKDLSLEYLRFGGKLAKTYAVPGITGVGSALSIFGSHHMLSTRCSTAIAGSAAIASQFKGYRDNVIDKYGKEVDEALRGIKTITTQEEVTQEDGTITIVDKEQKVIDDPNSWPEYDRLWDDCNPESNGNSTYDLSFLLAKQAILNTILETEGFLFLNDVYQILGFPKTKFGQTHGWIYCKDGNNEYGDNYVDFGIYTYPGNEGFLNGTEKGIWLHFNIDGYILNRI